MCSVWGRVSSAREAELRQLRKSNMEFEERNAALQKHVESMRTAVEKLEVDVIQERSRNTVLQQHLETLRQVLTSSFASMPLPGNIPLTLAFRWWRREQALSCLGISRVRLKSPHQEESQQYKGFLASEVSVSLIIVSQYWHSHPKFQALWSFKFFSNCILM